MDFIDLPLPSPTPRPPPKLAAAEKYAQSSLSLIKKDAVEDTPSDPVSSLSDRLSRVLNNPLSDAQIREYCAGINDTHIADAGVVGAVARKKIKGRFEEEVIKAHSAVLKEYQPTVAHLLRVKKELDRVSDLAKRANELVDRHYSASMSVSEQVGELRSKNSTIVVKRSLLANFRKQFTLNEYETFVLAEGDINDDFFEVLSRAEAQVQNCSVLLSIDNPRLGLKIIAQLNSLIAGAVERIVSYTNRSLGNMYNLSSKMGLVSRSLQYLKSQNGIAYSEVVSTFTQQRSKTVVDEFSAQTSESSSANSRPIIASAHDPLRFIGDLLAYVHSTVVNEVETIGAIFSQPESIVDEVLRAVAKPTRSKIDQIISIEGKISTIHQIYTLLELYVLMFNKLVPRSELVATVQSLIGSCQGKITSIIRSRLATIENSNSAQIELNQGGQQPPEWAVSFLTDIVPMLDQTTTPTVMNLPQEKNQEFLGLIVDEPIRILSGHIEANPHLFESKREQLILKANFYDLLLSKILPITLLSDKVLEITEKIAELTAELVSFQLDTLLKGCGLYDYYNVMRMISPLEDFDVDFYQPITENVLFTVEKVKEADGLVMEFVPNALLDAQNALTNLNAPSVVADVVRESGEEFTRFYRCFGGVVERWLGVGLTWGEEEVGMLMGITSSNSEQ